MRFKGTARQRMIYFQQLQNIHKGCVSWWVECAAQGLQL